MDIYIGNQTAFFTADPYEPFNFALAQGFDAFEWFADSKEQPGGIRTGWNFSDVDDVWRARLRELTGSGRMRFSVHAPWQANPLNKGGLEVIYGALDFAASIGATVMNTHLYAENGALAFATSILPAVQRAHELGLLLALENTPHVSPEDFNAVFALLAESPYFSAVGMCLDIGHANCSESTRNDYIRFIDRLSPQVRIIHAHIHENWGEADTHLTLFTGPARENDAGVRALAKRLKARDYSGILVLEQYPQPPDLLLEAERRLREIFGVPRHDAASAPVAEPLQAVGASASLSDTDAIAVPVSQLDNSTAAATDTAPYISPEDTGFAENPFARELVEFTRRNRSWRRRLQFVHELLLAEGFAEELENLALLAVYLRFIGTGELPCAEDGGHYRPSHHARAAQDIDALLERIADTDNRWLLRRIYPWLPAYGAEFQRREPLTRIRDIAHRSDIPQELKARIKHDLQNKLHRCAGPEDLRTAEEILADITAPGANLSPAFVAEFKVFYAELCEFFNAPELGRRLAALAGQMPELAPGFAAWESARSGGDALAKAESALALRRAASALVASAAPDLRQSLRIADIGLEDFAFAALSPLCGELEAEAQISPRWFSAARLTLEHIALGGYEAEECAALIGEFAAWGADFNPAERFSLLRLRASLSRARRLCDGYTDLLRDVFTPAVNWLGGAFRIAEEQLAVFVEADIRANLLFQLSRLCSCALERVRAGLALPPWDAIVAARASAPLLIVESIDEVNARSEPCILAVPEAAGDEEIPACVCGLLLGRPLPHLSHLAVRARGAGVALAAADTPEAFAALAAYAGKPVCLSVGAHGASIAQAQEDTPGAAPAVLPEVRAAETCDEVQPLLPIAAATAPTCGAKAAGAGRLIDLALASNGLFSAPRAMAIPFSAMQAALEADPQAMRDYYAIVATLNGLDGAEFDAALRGLRRTVNSLPVAPEVLAGVVEYFGVACRIAVRSSSNGEDLCALAGAGLYDSIVGVRADEVGSAVRGVWASLWTRRASFSRKRYGIPHDSIRMAVLIQEMVEPEYSFVLHTADPLSRRRDLLSMEIAAGLGETLVSASQPGEPWRLQVADDGAILQQSSASFSFALHPSDADGVSMARLAYAREPFSCAQDELLALARRLHAAGRFIEECCGGAQDIEGVLSGGTVYIVQTRPQAGI